MNEIKTLKAQLVEEKEGKAFLEKYGKNLTGGCREEIDKAIDKHNQAIKALEDEIKKREEDERTAAAIYDRRTERTLDGMKALFHQYVYEARYNTERTEEEIAMFIKLADEMKEKIFNYIMERMDEEYDYLPFN